MTIKELANYLRVEEHTALKIAKNNFKIRVLQVGTIRYFDFARSELDTWLGRNID